jgi:DNA repair exonuclease SbcCD ATPase subunit
MSELSIEAMQLAGKSRELDAKAERKRELARTLRQLAGRMDDVSFDVANRLSPDWWQGRAAAERHAEAIALWQEATWQAEQLEEVAHELKREARQLEEQASDCRALARMMGSEAHSWW